MKRRRIPILARPTILVLGVAVGWLLLGPATALAGPKVKLSRVPNHGIQPQALVDGRGAIHLLYFLGDPSGGDIFYVRQEPGEASFSAPVRVNSQPGTAIALGTIRGAQMALGRNGRVHVTWNGNRSDGQHRGPPMFYARLADAGTGFEPQRDLITHAAGLDGGGSVAADDRGNVYVVWHAPKAAEDEDETQRAVFVARSADEGRTFSRETPAIPQPAGACGCCGLRAFADRRGEVFVLFRAAAEKVNRDEILLASRDRGASFEIINSDPWKVTTCPMSSAWLSESPDRVLAAWETNAKIFLARVHPETLKLSGVTSPETQASCQHPVAASDARGEVLLAWTEGTGWEKGGAAAWQLYDAEGRTLEKGRANGVPAWGLVAAVPRADGGFLIFY